LLWPFLLYRSFYKRSQAWTILALIAAALFAVIVAMQKYNHCKFLSTSHAEEIAHSQKRGNHEHGHKQTTSKPQAKHKQTTIEGSLNPSPLTPK
jgi:hypothetical protein